MNTEQPLFVVPLPDSPSPVESRQSLFHTVFHRSPEAMALSRARTASASCQPARPAPTMTTPCALREVLVQAAVAQSLAWARSASRLGASYSAKSDLVTPHSGQA